MLDRSSTERLAVLSGRRYVYGAGVRRLVTMQLATLLSQRSSLAAEVETLRAESDERDTSAADRLRWTEAWLEMVEARIDETVGAAD
jgi:hypothetical protein